jgi:hypothetical protein
MWIFGGYGLASSTTQGVLSDVWQWSETTQTWGFMSGSRNIYEARKISGDSGYTPGGRYNPAYTQDDAGNFYLIGGLGLETVGNSLISRLFNDVWKYSTSTRTWTLLRLNNQLAWWGTKGVEAEVNFPPSVQRASAAYANGHLYLYGGEIANHISYNALWKFNLSSNLWTWVSGSSEGDQPGVYTLHPESPSSPSAPTSSPTASPVEAPAPVDVPSQVPSDETPSAVPVETPPPVEPSPVETPFLYPVETPFSSPVETPSPVPTSSPVETPFSSPVETPVPTSSPSETPPLAESPLEPPVDSSVTKRDFSFSSKPTASTKRHHSATGPGSRSGHLLRYVSLEGQLYLHGGIGLDEDGFNSTLNDLWTYDIIEDEWSWVSGGSKFPLTTDYGSPGEVGVPDGRWMSGFWIDDWFNLWFVNGYDGEENRNDIWSYSLLVPPPLTPDFTPVLPPPPSSNGPNTAPQGTFEPVDPSLCSLAKPVEGFQCAGANLWVFGGDLTAPEGDWTLSQNTTIRVYGDLIVGSRTNLIIEYGTTIQVMGKLDFYGSLTLQVSYWTLLNLNKYSDESPMRTVRLFTHHEGAPSSSKRGSRAFQVKFVDSSMESSEKRTLLAVNDPIDQGSPRVTDSKCASYSYYLNDKYLVGDTYELSATIYNIRSRCNQYWWAWLILALILALIATVLITIFVMHFVFKKRIFGGDQRPNRTVEDPAHSKNPAGLRVGVDPVIDMHEIDISASGVGDDAYEQPSYEDELEEESEQEGSEEASEEEEEVSEEQDEEEDEDREELTDEESSEASGDLRF